MTLLLMLLALALGGCAATQPPPLCPAIVARTTTPMTVEIFDVGVYPMFGERHRITTADLDQIVANFYRLKPRGWKVPLKLGHGPQQLIGGAQGKEGDPALGWVEDVERRGTKLVAHVVGIPNIVGVLMARGQYRRVSMEWLVGFEDTFWEANMRSGARGYVLEAVAILGADIPKVQSLADLAEFL